MKTVKTQCASCGGTGLYQGMCEKPNEPVVCLSCNGTGCHEISYEPYTGRNTKWRQGRPSFSWLLHPHRYRFH